MPLSVLASSRLAPAWPLSLSPIPASNAPAGPAADDVVGRGGTDGDRVHILVVDDSPSIHEDFRKILAGEQVCGELFELDGRKSAPINCGKTDNFLMVSWPMCVCLFVCPGAPEQRTSRLLPGGLRM